MTVAALPTLVLLVTVISGVIVAGLLIADLRKDRRVGFTPTDTPAAQHPPMPRRDLGQRWGRLRERAGLAVRLHPAPALGWIETAWWVLTLVALFDHVRDPRGSWTAFLAWALTIGPHELGHIICMPFGTFIMFAGGSIWQLLWWFGVGGLTLTLRRQITITLLTWMIGGHSLINLAQYIGDARAKQLPLLFGLGAEHHDWSNLLGMLGLLGWDSTLAATSTLLGIMVIVACAGAGIVTTWVLPRAGVGNRPRFQGAIWRALRAALPRAPHP